MAQPIHCDFTGCGELADVMVSRTANGETLAWCDDHYLVMCEAIAAQVAQLRAGVEPELTGNMVVDDAIDHLATEAADTAVAARLDFEPRAPDHFPTSDDWSAADEAPPEPPTKPAGGRKNGGVATETTPEPIDAPGANLAGTEGTGGTVEEV